MPNWTENNVLFVGKKKQLETLKTMLKSKDNDFDFNNIVPMPKNIYRGLLGREEEEKYGDNNWYRWSIDNWGTKWNSVDTRVEENGSTLSYNFMTAWDCPRQIVDALMRMRKTILKDISINWDCVHEDGNEHEVIVDIEVDGGKNYEETHN
mgnify:CR=1 FL=1|tara:strand:- start:47 stop:499 length:453 start_codon:yes stop_codon:yes gene_type:complete